MKTSQLMWDTTWGPQLCLCSFVSKGQTHTKEMESLSMAMQNSQIHNQPIQPISIYILFHLLLSDVLDARKAATINPDRTVISKLTLPFYSGQQEVGRGFRTHLLNFTFSIRYFLRVHKGVEYPLQEKSERMHKRRVVVNVTLKQLQKAHGWGNRCQKRTVSPGESLMPRLPKGNHVSVYLFVDLHEEAGFVFEGKDITGFFKTSVNLPNWHKVLKKVFHIRKLLPCKLWLFSSAKHLTQHNYF